MTNATENMSLEPTTPGTQQRTSSPSRFQKAKSILRGQKPGLGEQKSRPSLPLTTPFASKKAAKKVTFTPDTARAPMGQKSPSPQKSGFVGRAKAMLGLENKQPAGSASAKASAGPSGDVVYPDLSSHLSGLKDVIEPGPNEVVMEDQGDKSSAAPTPTGAFSFRSDRTIHFGGASPSGFGALPGQSSIRAVRESIKPSSEMPGGFPTVTTSLSPTSNSNKENAIPSPPKVLIGALHGMSNKKRRRVSADSDMADVDDERAAKKKRSQTDHGAIPRTHPSARARTNTRTHGNDHDDSDDNSDDSDYEDSDDYKDDDDDDDAGGEEANNFRHEPAK
ncbi:hypothetical protein ESCO_000150 [Escovopsis weberi]|uniref:Uncharacterized protein n=1 Tax=Escovopsis weberi TaxID=150374 RepID=A0A0N0RT91_ESCWE|nr:hypothetical protein ESCO_000150 [Escovopsis weberi]